MRGAFAVVYSWPTAVLLPAMTQILLNFLASFLISRGLCYLSCRIKHSSIHISQLLNHTRKLSHSSILWFFILSLDSLSWKQFDMIKEQWKPWSCIELFPFGVFSFIWLTSVADRLFRLLRVDAWHVTYGWTLNLHHMNLLTGFLFGSVLVEFLVLLILACQRDVISACLQSAG